MPCERKRLREVKVSGSCCSTSAPLLHWPKPEALKVPSEDVQFHCMPALTLLICYLSIYFSLSLFGCTHGMWKFLGQGSNPCHCSNPIQHIENAGSLTCCTTRELLKLFFFFFFFFFAFSRVTPVAYGGSQARGLIGAVVAGPHQNHSIVGSEPRL